MKKEIAELQQKLDASILYIKDQLKRAQGLDLTDPLREEYAISLAAKLRVLLNDENNNVSLLHRLGIKNKLRFQAIKEYSILTKSPANMLFSSLLTSLCTINEELFCKVNDFDPAEDLMYTFDAWWNEIIIDSKFQHLSQISRRDVILTLTDKEGGAHVDPNYDDAHYQARGYKGVVYKTSNGEEKLISNDVYAEAMLFIAMEFLNSYLIHINISPYLFQTETSRHKILQLTYFRQKEIRDRVVYEKRYRFLRYKTGEINKYIMVLFDYYQPASYRILDLYQICKRYENGNFRYAHVIDLNSHSVQIVYARTEDCRTHKVLLKNKNKFKIIDSLDTEANHVGFKRIKEIVSELSPDAPDAFEVYFSKQIVDEPNS